MALRYGADEEQRHWGVVFAIASLITPFLLGTTAGTIASGALGEARGAKGDGFYAIYVAPWLNPFPLSVGLFALITFAFLAAVYLTLEAQERELQEDFRRRALAAGVGLFLAAVMALIFSLTGAPRVRDGLIFAAWALPLHLLTAAAAITALAALWVRRWRVARVAAVTQVSLILWGWALSQYPYILPPDLSIAGAAAPAATLRLVLGALALGAVVLLPSLYYLFRVFKSSVRATYHTGLHRGNAATRTARRPRPSCRDPARCGTGRRARGRRPCRRPCRPGTVPSRRARRARPYSSRSPRWGRRAWTTSTPGHGGRARRRRRGSRRHRTFP